MNKIELNRLSQVNNNEQNFLAALNENLKRIQEAINDTLSRTGVKPNQMEEVLDMNGNRICNVGPAVELTDVVTKQDIQNIIDAANEAIARLDGLVEAGRVALMNYAQEYIYPTVTAALDGAQAAQRAAEAARDALLLNPDYQALTQNLPTIMTLVDNITVLENIRDNMTELLAVSDDLTNIDAVAADLTNLDAIAGNLEEILRSSTYAQQAAQSASQASTSASNAANSATAAAGSATAASGSATTATNKANEASASATAASGSASNAADSATAAASSATTAANKANTARIWAEGTDGEVVPLGGSHSAKVWAQYVEEIIAGTRIFGGSFDATTATATLTSAAKAKLNTDANTIVLTNDTTPITGYAANEAIEYVVTVDGTFAGMTLKVNDILWSSGLAWYKIDNSETVIADATESTKGIAALASTAEAEAGLNDTKIMTPLKTKQAILELAPAPEDASESTKGVIELANESEATGGSNDTKAMTPETTKKAIAAQTYNSLSASQRATLLSAGTYMGDTVSNGKIFETDSGKFEQLVDDAQVAWTHSSGSSIARYGSALVYTGQAYLGAFGSDPSSSLKRSTDGINWTNVSVPASYRWNYGSASDGNGVVIFRAGNTTTNVYIRSADHGLTWELKTLPASWMPRDDATKCANGVFFTARSGNYYYSTDKALTWTQASFPTTYMTDVVYIAPNYFALGQASNNLGVGIYKSTSPAGPWTLCVSTTATTLAASDTTIAALSTYQQYVCVYSNDKGSTWNTSSLPLSEVIRNVLYANGVFFGYSDTSNKFVYSTDAVTWQTGSTGLGTINYGSVAGGDCFIGTAYNLSVKSVYGVTHDYSLTPLSYTKSEVDTALAGKQGTLSAGTGISIASNTVAATAMTGADGTNAGTLGAVPAPAATDNTKFLRGDGTWAEAAQEPSYDSSSMTIQL